MSIYRKGDSKFWWYRFTFKKKRVQRSTKTENKREAKDIERAAWTQFARAEVGIEEKPKRERATVGALLDKLKEHYQSEGKASAQNLSTIEQAREAFGKKMSDELTEQHVETYIAARLKKGRKPATVNRVLEATRRAFRIAKLAAPEFRHLSEKGNVRQGFFTVQELEHVVQNLPQDLRDFTRFAFATAWRKSEVASLRWSDVEDGVVRLRDSKNGEPRQVVIDGELPEIIKRRRALRAVSTADGTIFCDYIFHRNGEPIREFRKSWARACVAAKVGVMFCPKCQSEGEALTCCKRPTKYRGRILHDLRRSGIRDMIRGKVSQTVAMKISGHKTASMFRRYDITDEGDLREAMLSVQKYREAERSKVTAIGGQK
jgi:integrase